MRECVRTRVGGPSAQPLFVWVCLFAPRLHGGTGTVFDCLEAVVRLGTEEEKAKLGGVHHLGKISRFQLFRSRCQDT